MTSPSTRKISTCEHCRTEFVVKKDRLGLFCSRSCYHAHRRERIETRLRFIESNGHWLWSGSTDVKGYGFLGIVRDGKHKTIRAHRFAYELASGKPIPTGMNVLHTCDIRACVRNDERGEYTVDGVTYPRFGHLVLAPQSVNIADAIAKGRHQRGERSGSAVLTEDDVRMIRTRLANGETKAELARAYGVGFSTIRAIVIGRNWKHVL